MKNLLNLFLAFLRCGIFGFGGGHGTIPLIQKEVVETYRWLTIEEFTDALALGNSLPGPIATKLAALIGYKTAGTIGAVISTIGIVIPSSIAIIILLKLYQYFSEKTWFEGMMKGVRPVVVILIAQVVFSMTKKSFPDMATVIIGALAAIILFGFNVHPIFLIVPALLYGAIFM